MTQREDAARIQAETFDFFHGVVNGLILTLPLWICTAYVLYQRTTSALWIGLAGFVWLEAFAWKVVHKLSN